MTKKKNKKLKKTVDKKNNLGFKKLFLVKVFFSLLIFFFLSFNVFFSQNIPPLYQKLVNEERKAVIEYLKSIKSLPFFKTELKKFAAIFGRQIVNEVFFEDQQRKIKIKKLEEALKKNPKSRDVLMSLAILYQEDGNEKLAREYFNKVKEVDPNLSITIK